MNEKEANLVIKFNYKAWKLLRSFLEDYSLVPIPFTCSLLNKKKKNITNNTFKFNEFW
jgi:hypothetical protein